jgi:AcrR family transcriptional regulator
MRRKIAPFGNRGQTKRVTFTYQTVGFIMNDSKEHILKTSLQLFLQKSFKEVTMKDIVSKTGLSKGAFYHYFSSKEQVFEEVIDHYYGELIGADYNLFSQESFAAFYNDALNDRRHKTDSSRIKKDSDAHHGNHYLILFDALRMLPGFKKKRIEALEAELAAWTKSIRAAKKKGEIKTGIPDETLAKLFIYSGKGCSISYLMVGSADDSAKEVRKIWDEMYKGLQQ